MKISIVTPSFNSGPVIKRAIESVLSQDYDKWEHIIIDGGSTDGTLETLKEYPHLKILSEPDNGQADAMNKGIGLATGDIIGFLNADDYYYPSAFSSVIEAFDKSTDIVIGNVLVKSRRMNFEFLNTPRTDMQGMLRHWEPNAFCYNPVGYFCTITLQKKCKFNALNYASMDLEFLLDAAEHTQPKRIEVTLGCFEDSTDTKTDKTQLMPDYWRVSTFPYIERHLHNFSDDERQTYIKERRIAYSLQQREANARAKKRQKRLPYPKKPTKVSVVIPTHNDVHLACDAIDSVLRQSYKNIEIIVVDDASSLNALEFLQTRYSLETQNIQVHRHARNKMLGGSRNTGISVATGDYIFFLDSDDQLQDEAIERLVTIATACDVEIVQGGTLIQDSMGRLKIFHSEDFASDGGLDGLELYSKHQFASLAWNKLYKAEFLQRDGGPRFVEKFAHEDVVFSAKTAYLTNSIVSISDPIIIYRYNSGSITRKKPTQASIDSYISMYMDLFKTLNDFGVVSNKSSALAKDVMDAHIASDLGPKLLRCNQSMGRAQFKNLLTDSCGRLFGGHGIALASMLAYFIDIVEHTQNEVRIIKEKYEDGMDNLSPNIVRPRIVIDGIFWQYNNTGIARVWANLLSEWVQSGFSENLVVLDRGGTAPKIKGINYLKIAKYDYAQTGAESIFLQDLCDKLEADLFVSTYYTSPTTTPSFFVGYDMIPEVCGFDLDQPVWQEKRKAILHAAGHSMISNSSAADLGNYYPNLSSDSIFISYPAVANEFKRASPDSIRRLRGKLGLSDKPYIVFVGNRNSYKNGILAFRAFADLPSDNKWILLCVGGYIEIESELLVETAGLDVRRVVLNDDELVAAYSGAHCLIYPSKYEGFGLPPLEAMACGTPTIVCRNSSLPEAVGNAAIFVDDTDPIEARNAIVALLDQELRDRVVTEGYRQVKEFSFENMSVQMRSAFSEIHDRLSRRKIDRPSTLWSELRTTERSLQIGKSRQATSLPDSDVKNVLLDEKFDWSAQGVGIDLSCSTLPSFVIETGGLDAAEAWGRWTIGRECFLNFIVPLPPAFTLEVYGWCFESSQGKPIRVDVGEFSSEIVMIGEDREEPYCLNIINRTHASRIVFHIPEPQSPANLTSGVFTDQRELGLAISHLRIIKSIVKPVEVLTNTPDEVPPTPKQSHILDWSKSSRYNIDFTKNFLPDFVKDAKGLDITESWGRWTVGPAFIITFYGPLPKHFVLELKGKVYDSNHGLPITVALGSFTTSFIMSRKSQDLPYRIEMSNYDDADSIALYIPNPQSPSNYRKGISSDHRELGIAIIEIVLLTESDDSSVSESIPRGGGRVRSLLSAARARL